VQKVRIREIQVTFTHLSHSLSNSWGKYMLWIGSLLTLCKMCVVICLLLYITFSQVSYFIWPFRNFRVHAEPLREQWCSLLLSGCSFCRILTMQSCVWWRRGFWKGDFNDNGSLWLPDEANLFYGRPFEEARRWWITLLHFTFFIKII